MPHPLKPEANQINSRQIVKTGLVKRGANGVEAIVFVDGDERDGDLRWAEVKSFPSPKVELGSELWLDNDERVRLPFNALPWILPDRKGGLVLFSDGEYTHPDGSDIFPKPNNAAIYNADGSLRFQLKLPAGTIADRIGGVHSGGMREKFKDMMGVVIATHPEGYPEWVYAVDPNQPELIATNQWVRW